MKNVILDCDPGIDDALAIIMAIKGSKMDLFGDQRFNIAGVTTVSGNGSIKQTTHNALKLIHFLHEDQNIPVFQGEGKPLVFPPVEALEVHGIDGMGDILAGPPPISSKKLRAYEFIINTVLDFPRYKKNESDSLSIIATGPLTNIAKALEIVKKEGKLDKFCANIDKIIIMGGSIKESGNITRAAEFNIFADPHAAKIVLNSPISNKILVPLDVTRKVLVIESDLKKISALIHKKNEDMSSISLLEFVYKIINRYHKFNVGYAGLKGSPMHDPLAVAVFLDPSLVKTTPLDVKVSLGDKSGFKLGGSERDSQKREDHSFQTDLTRGMTIAELRNGIFAQEADPNVNVCLNADSQRFKSLFFHLLTYF